MKRILLALLLSAPFSFGQTSLATITGTITDGTGAVLANAPVEVKNRDNGQIFRAASSATGNYSVLQLPIGDYDLTISVPGFKTYAHTTFHLAAAQIMREDVTLEVGQTTESVTVTAETSLLKTESTEVSQNVTLAQLNNLPILAVAATGSGFRDPFVSTRLVPGIRYTNGTNSAAGAPGVVTTMSINGTPANTYGTRLDGMTMNPTGPRLISAVMQTQPSVDAIEEVAIQTSNFAAEFGAAGGAMINMVTKSGTNTYHGSAYDYGTNEALNAHTPYTGLRSKIRQSDFGVTFGGPLRIPKVYDGKNKTFFFFSMEIFKQTNLVQGASSVPTAAYRLGNFGSLLTAENRLITTAGGNAVDSLGRTMQSGTIFDPSTQRPVAGKLDVRDPFPSNSIPVSRFDPISAKVLALVPNPQGVNFERGLVSNNYQGTYDTSRTSKIPSIKLDQNVGSKGRLSFYLQETNTRSPTSTSGADPLPLLISGGNTTFSSGTTVRLNYDYTITPRILFHIGVGWNDSDFQLGSRFVTPYDASKELGLKGALVPLDFPRIVTAVNGNTQIGGMSSLGQTGRTASFERRPSGTASLSYVTGSHTYKFGVDYRIEKFPNVILGGANGTYAFGPNYTEQPSLQGITTNQGFDGFEFASFMLGGLSASGLTNVGLTAPINLSNNKSQTGIYAQDTWKVTRKLTFDYGLRWDLGTYAAESYGRNGSIGLAVPNPSASGRLGGMQFEQVCKCNFAKNYPYAYGPRIGAAYQINSKTVFRAGLGVVYNSTSTSSGSSTAGATAGSLPGNSGQINGLFKDGLPASVVAVWPSFNAGVSHPNGGVIGMPALLDPNAGRPGRLLQWNIALQREINRNLVIDASYVGNRGVWWTAGGLAPLNAISESTIRRYGFTDFTSLAEANLLTANVSTLATNTAARTTLASRGITGIPYASFPTSQNVRQSLRDYPQYTNGNLAGAPLGNTWYDSFQLTVTQRFTRGLSFNMNYNFSKNLDLMSATDVFNRANGKSFSGNDRPHSLRMTLQYVVPKVSGNRFVSYALSDWGLGAYLAYESAAALARPSSNGTVPLSLFLGRGPGSAQLKKDADGSYMNPYSVNWVDYDGKQRTDPLDINCHCYDPTKTQVLNPNAWENIPNGQWAADQSDLRFFRGIRIPTENANFSRNFRMKEGVTLNVRVEFNNIFNRMMFLTPGGASAGPSVAGNFITPPTRFAAGSGASAGLYSGGFGTISVLNGLGGQRTGTFVARLTF
ncbi:MAG: carboxypeptidase-like regulatory domain-containing protein [Bryobacteraceae bacterium]